MISSPMKTDAVANTLMVMRGRIVLFINRFSLRAVLFTGFSVVILLGMTAAALTEWSAYVAHSAMDRFVYVDNTISDLCLKSTTAMVSARRFEKDFLLTYKEFGFPEARSRYISRVLTSLADITEFMTKIRFLTNDPEFVRWTREVDQAINEYQGKLIGMIDRYGILGDLNTGIEGAMRARAHEMERLLNPQGSDTLLAGYLSMRRREKDFIVRIRDADAAELRKAVILFNSHLAASGLPAEQKVKLGALAQAYHALFEQYAETIEEIRAMKKGTLKSAQTFEPALEKLYHSSLANVTVALNHVKKIEAALDLIKVVIGLLIFSVSMLVAFAVSRSVSTSVVESQSFAERIASGDLTNRLAPRGLNEFVTLAIALNNMAEALQNAAEKHKQQDSRIRFLAYYDGLTGLSNRMFFKELLKKALVWARRYGQAVVILYLDVDDFKRVNDTLGHPMGDKLLLAVSERLVASVRSSDSAARLAEDTEQTTVSRLGGDEFAILLHNAGKIHEVSRVARRLLKEIAKPFDLDGHEVFTSASMGISFFPSGGEDADNLLKNADAAMYQAKAKGKNNYQFYTDAMNATALELFNLERDLHRALEREEFVLHYQPKLDTTRRMIGMEALIRWNHKEKGMISPVQFIPLAEDTGLILPIGEWVLRTACLQTNAWQEAGFKSANVAVNLSARQFDQKNLPDIIARALHETALPPRHLELEITESMIMQKPEEAIAVLRKLKNMGIRISMDDFGTGYSSLNYLRQLPVDSLKIDRSFIMNVTIDPGDAAIVKGIIALAHSLKLKVIAEGVETEAQFEFLREVECDEVQGFLFSKPLPADEFLGVWGAVKL
ncbi:MAG: EAL domain-containing protein [Deltaproteobacteria bacterium]|nr:EAL domain-containing protein [Deltaproteobacteria bacterium]